MKRIENRIPLDLKHFVDQQIFSIYECGNLSVRISLQLISTIIDSRIFIDQISPVYFHGHCIQKFSDDPVFHRSFSSPIPHSSFFYPVIFLAAGNPAGRYRPCNNTRAPFTRLFMRSFRDTESRENANPLF